MPGFDIQPNKAVTAPQLTNETVYVLLGCLLICLLYIVTTLAFTMPARTSVMNDTYMEKFDRKHKEHFADQDKAPRWGYPDTGNGFFSR